MSFETNLRAAGQAISVVRFICSFGAANKPTDVERNRVTLPTGGNFSKTKVLEALLVREYYKRDVDLKPRAERIPIDAALGATFRTGTCETQASIAFSFLQRLGTPRPIDFMALTNDAHAFVLIGRTGDPADWTKWGADAVVCDPWLNECPSVSSDGAGAEWAAWPFRPAAWAGTDFKSGTFDPQKLSTFTFKSECRIEG